ncbi:hypothetical protein KKG66_07970 [bacterium]|nr:hypothetical protein [bacterium]
MSNTPPKNDAKEVAARKKVVRNLTVSGIIIVLRSWPDCGQRCATIKEP